MTKEEMKLEDLAIMIQNGFESVESRLDGVENRLTGVEYKLTTLEKSHEQLQKGFQNLFEAVKEIPSPESIKQLDRRMDGLEDRVFALEVKS